MAVLSNINRVFFLFLVSQTRIEYAIAQIFRIVLLSGNPLELVFRAAFIVTLSSPSAVII